MTYPDTLYFVGKCLILETNPEKVALVQTEIESGKVDWEKVVQVTSGQFVLPAFYLQLKRASLLGKLPQDLIEYLEYLTETNRERNRSILQQVKDISALFQKHNIQPVFLKGVAHLLSNLYEDNAERMVGDIDVLVDSSQVIKAAELLIAEGYQTPVEYVKPIHDEQKHYPRLMNERYSSAVEVHREVLLPPYHKKFKGENIIRNVQRIENNIPVFIPSTQDLIIHNALNIQINDKAYLNHEINMRQMYDLLCLSKKADPAVILGEFGKYRKMTNAWLGISSKILEYPETISYEDNKSLRFNLWLTDFFLDHPFIHQVYLKIIYIIKRIQRYITLPFQSIFNVEKRRGLFARLSNPGWYITHVKSYQSFFKSGNR